MTDGLWRVPLQGMAGISVNDAMRQAAQLCARGDFLNAEAICRTILKSFPDNADVLHQLGAVCGQTGRIDEAYRLIGKAISIKPDNAKYHMDMGNVWVERGDFDQAVLCYCQAMQLEPGYAGAQNALGLALSKQGKFQDAIRQFDSALKIAPNYVDARHNLGNALSESGRYAQALPHYRQVLRARPDYAEAHYHLGNALLQLGRINDAADSYRRAIKLNPGLSEAYNNLGDALKQLGLIDDGIASIRRAIQLKPQSVEAHNNLGNVLKHIGLYEDALACYRRAMEINPRHAGTHNNMGNVLIDLKMLPEGIASFRRALELKPDFLTARVHLIHQLQRSCLWNDLEEHSMIAAQAIEMDVSGAAHDPDNTPVPFAFLSITTPPTTARQQWLCSRRWGKTFMASDRPTTHGAALPSRAAGAKIRLGYLSADYREHPVARLIVELFEKHDRGRFEVFGYSIGPDDGSEIRRRVLRGMDRFTDVKDELLDVTARRIAGDGVDILIDLTGHTQYCRTELLAMRPAPIQVNYLGYPGTMGVSFIDYILVDDFIVPPDQQPFFTEKLVHLPGCYQVNDSQRPVAAYTPARAQCGLPEKGFVFCCFNNPYKVSPAMFDVWMRLLRALPDSVVWLLAGNSWVMENLRREAKARGVAPDRLVFATNMPQAQHLARYRLADLFLDSYPYNAHTTASDALWVGCPVLTLTGETFISRVAGSLLRSVGLPELITTGFDDFERLALKLGQDRPLLDGLKARLAANRQACGLFDAGRFAKGIERAYETMWEIHASGQEPRAFAVAPD